MRNPFRYFNSSPEVIRLTVIMYIRYPLSLRQVEDLFFERGFDICHEGIATNISKEGLFISTKTALNTGYPLKLKLHLSQNEPPDQCYGRVARLCYDSFVPGVGIELEYKTPIRRRRIYNFIRQEEARLIEKD